MTCPKCHTNMVTGKALIGGGGTSLLLGGGVSFGNLTFKAEAWSDHILQDTSDVLPAHYCDNCGALTLETTRPGLSTLET